MHSLTFSMSYFMGLRRDAAEAANRRNNYDYYGYRLRCEIARGGEASREAAVKSAYRPPRNSAGYRLFVKGLPKSASWQDLKVGESSIPTGRCAVFDWLPVRGLVLARAHNIVLLDMFVLLLLFRRISSAGFASLCTPRLSATTALVALLVLWSSRPG